MGHVRITLVALAAAGFLAGCKGAAGERTEGRVVAAGPAKLRDAISLSGSVQPVVQVDLKAEVSGRILSLPVKEGEVVRKGELLVKLDPEPFQLKVDRAQLAVDRASLALAKAAREVERAKALLTTGTISADGLQDLETSRKQAALDLRDAELQRRETRKDLADASVRAPMDGQLISLNVEEGEMAASAISLSGGTALGVVADPSRMKVEVEVGELDYPRLRLGMPVEVSTGVDGGRPMKGKVSFVSSSARASSASSTVQVFPVEVTLLARDSTERGDSSRAVRPKRDSTRKDASGGKGWAGKKGAGAAAATQLVSGMTVSVDFVFLLREVPVAVPQAAIRKGRETTVLVRTAQGTEETRTVRTGDTDYRNIEILEGLQAGDSVVVAAPVVAKKGPGGPP